MATIIGTENSDTLTDTSAVDSIDALGGDDVIVLDAGGGVGETVDGGAGNDRLVLDRRLYNESANLTVKGGANPGPGPGYSGQGVVNFANIEHFTIYHNPDRLTGDSVTTGAGDDVYVYKAANNNTFSIRYFSFINLGAGSNDRIVIDASAVTYQVQNVVDSNPNFMRFRINGSTRVDYTQAEHLEFIGGSEGDTIVGLVGSDILDGRGGDDSIDGAGGDDRLIGGTGNDSLNGGEGDDTLVFTSGTDAADGGNGTDRLEVDARGQGGSILFGVGGSGPAYASSVTWAGGSVNFSGIESFTVYSNPGDYADSVDTGSGDDVFHHYGIDSLTYSMDTLNLGAGSNDLLVADFSAVTSYAVTNSPNPNIPGWYLFAVGGSEKIRYTGVERVNFIGGAQGDSIIGHTGNDILDGRAGDDTLASGNGNDDLTGGTGTNAIDAGNDDDIIRSVSAAIDTVQGGGGFDTAIIDYSAQTAAVTNVAGGDIAFGNGGDTKVTLTSVERFIIATGSGNDDIATLGGNDEIRTGAGADVLNAGAGNDYLDGGSGTDAMTGGPGDDVYIVDDSGDTITEASGEGTDIVYASSSAYVLAANLENLIATGGGAHNLRGNGGDNVVTGEVGNDLLLMQDGGVDLASGLAGNDVIYFGAAWTSADHADGGSGRDSLVLQGNYAITLSNSSAANFESVSLQSGANSSFGDTANNFYDFDITTANDLVAAGQQLIVNGQSLRAGEDFTFNGSAETDGKFLIYGGHGVDDLTGGAGVDVFFFEGARWGATDKVDGGAGRDAIVISAGSGVTHIEFAADALTSIESISVNKQFATDPSQVPSYEFVLNNGNVAPGATLIVNAASLASTAQTVNIDGNGIHDGNLILFGGAGNDTLTAGDGADLLVGGGLTDALTGGAGADTFRYDAASDSTASAPDLIGDFATGTDKVDLSRIDANIFAGGNQAFTWIGSSAFAGTGASSAGELRLFQDNGFWRVEGDTDGNGSADLVIVFQVGTVAPVQSDFLV